MVIAHTAGVGLQVVAATPAAMAHKHYILAYNVSTFCLANKSTQESCCDLYLKKLCVVTIEAECKLWGTLAQLISPLRHQQALTSIIVEKHAL